MKRALFEAVHDEFRSSLRQALARSLDGVVETGCFDAPIPAELWRVLGASGFLGFMVPEEFGGGGVDDFRFNAVLAEELAVYGVGYASSFGINTDVVAPYLLELTTRAQKERWLPRFASGELITAIGMTEPGAGSDLGRMATTALREGDEWRLNGSKTFITNGSRADLVVLAARTPQYGERSITLFGVESGVDGFRQGAPLHKVGQPQVDTAELFLDDVRLADHAVIGEVGGGFAAMMQRLPTERLSVAIVCVAHAAFVLEQTIEYAKQRVAFGQAIGTFQHNKFVLADLVTSIDVVRCFVDACVLAKIRGELEPVAAAQAKLVASEMQGKVIDACLQLHGGYGYMLESYVARAWTDARVTRIWGGTNEIMHELIGRSIGL